jgi:hypothetical protein
MTSDQINRHASDRWPGPGGAVEDSIFALADLVRDAADRLDDSDPHIARALRLRATKLAMTGIRGLLDLKP